jgi:hypothetical protein
MNFFERLQQLPNVAQFLALHISSADSQDLAIPDNQPSQSDSVVDHHAQMVSVLHKDKRLRSLGKVLLGERFAVAF